MRTCFPYRENSPHADTDVPRTVDTFYMCRSEARHCIATACGVCASESERTAWHTLCVRERMPRTVRHTLCVRRPCLPIPFRTSLLSCTASCRARPFFSRCVPGFPARLHAAPPVLGLKLVQANSSVMQTSDRFLFGKPNRMPQISTYNIAQLFLLSISPG